MQQVPERSRWVLLAVACGLGLVGVAVLAFTLGRGAATSAPPPTEAAFAGTIELATPQAGGADESNDTTKSATPAASAVPSAPDSVVVYISGAVQQPDTYRMPVDARVKDVVLAAGGLASDADSDHVNLSEHISDAQHIHIPHIGEAVTLPQGTAAPAAGAAKGAAQRLNLNTASSADLEALPRIGKALAQRIIDWRTANGPFHALEDVQKVKGVSPAVFEAIKQLIMVE